VVVVEEGSGGRREVGVSIKGSRENMRRKSSWSSQARQGPEAVVDVDVVVEVEEEGGGGVPFTPPPPFVLPLSPFIFPLPLPFPFPLPFVDIDPLFPPPFNTPAALAAVACALGHALGQWTFDRKKRCNIGLCTKTCNTQFIKHVLPKL
jgi:hypothetical protein